MAALPAQIPLLSGSVHQHSINDDGHQTLYSTPYTGSSMTEI